MSWVLPLLFTQLLTASKGFLKSNLFKESLAGSLGSAEIFLCYG